MRCSSRRWSSVVCFFFQAEDGIRDLTVTGVQTCALPISSPLEAKTQLSKLVDQAARGEAFVIAKAGKPLVKVAALEAPAAPRRLGFLAGEIGRASCRGRV